MKNEVMARAVTDIDDNLITEAQVITKRSNRLRPVYSIAALAACLVLVFTLIFNVVSSGSFGLFIGNEKISDKPIAVNSPTAAYARIITREQTVSLSLKTKEPTKITVSAGVMSVCSAGQTDTLYHKGTEYTTDIPVNIHWTVDGSDTTKSYTLTLNDGEEVYALSFDEGTSLWSICKQ